MYLRIKKLSCLLMALLVGLSTPLIISANKSQVPAEKLPLNTQSATWQPYAIAGVVGGTYAFLRYTHVGKKIKKSHFFKNFIKPVGYITGTTMGLVSLLVAGHRANLISEKNATALATAVFSAGITAGLGFLFNASIKSALESGKQLDQEASNKRSSMTREQYGRMPKEVEQLVDYAKDSAVRKQYKDLGLSPARGYLLHGPPGTGKTELINVLHTEGLSVIEKNLSQIMSKYYGESQQQIVTMFQEVRDKAEKHPSGIAVLFIDEIDALGTKRADNDMIVQQKSYGDTILTCLLQQMSAEANKNVIVIGCTNNPNVLDPALLSRLTKKIYINLDTQKIQDFIFKELALMPYQFKNDERARRDLACSIAQDLHNRGIEDLREIKNLLASITQNAIHKNPHTPVTLGSHEILTGIETALKDYPIRNRLHLVPSESHSSRRSARRNSDPIS